MEQQKLFRKMDYLERISMPYLNDNPYEVDVRFASRGFDSAIDPPYEKFDDFGPMPVHRRIKRGKQHLFLRIYF